MEIDLNKKVLMFHEVLDDFITESGFHTISKGKYSISITEFRNIVDTFADNVLYTFDDGGISNLIAADYLKFKGIKGYFFICTAYIGNSSFLSQSQIEFLAVDHYILPHGHMHIMNIVDEDILYNDWKYSVDIISNIAKTHISAVCLPGGTFSRVHKNVLLRLNINTVFHSAPSNIVLSLLYPNSFIFIPRLIITKGWKEGILNFQMFKSYIKQILYFRN